MLQGGLRVSGINKISSQDKPLVSVITPVFNGARTLEQTILSVINQTYNNIEYIIVDGGSTDETVEILRRYEDKIDFWKSESDNGIYDAMNKGISLSHGLYVYFIGCDDWLIDKNVISKIIPYMNKGYDVISGQVFLVYKNGFQKLYENRYLNTREDDITARVISSPHQGMFVKTQVMKKHSFDTKYKIAADYKSLLELWLDRDISILKIDSIVAYYNNDGTSGKSITKRRNETLSIQDEFKFWNKTLYDLNTGKKKITWYVKDFLILLRINRLKMLLSLILGFLRHKVVKHNCKWDFCRVCKKNSFLIKVRNE